NVWFDDVNTAAKVKTSITKSLTEKGLAKYWNVETFREYEFTKDILEQLQSEKYLFSLLAIIIMIVACSNIISMLVLLVNDKKKEIGILQSMGASRWSVALIFGFCGIIIGIISSGIGTIAAIATMHNLPAIIDVLSAIQGHELLNSTFYGDTLPTTLSAGTLKFVIIATATTSLLAGVIPAIKASLLNPTKLLRSE
ncbi:MAG: FtsX-like permease family protein, partial [Waddliaceae bacterium]|nr:FtsX-like permease family protein [Waddliaceae bacterium]